MQRLIYTLTMYLLTPVILYRLVARGLRHRDYLDRWRERFGFFPDPGIRDAIWLHAVSMGEVNAAQPLIEALMKRYVGVPLVITTVTPTGSERVRKLFGDRVFHVYLPYDLTASVERFLDRVQPRIAVIMETEIWPNLFMTCHERGIPLVVANARLSERSLKGYGPVRPLARRAIRRASFVAAQSAPDYARLTALGAVPAKMAIVGNLKFDLRVPASVIQHAAEFKQHWGADRPVWFAASTHEGEEIPVLEAHATALRRFPDTLLLIAPRHPERFKPVAAACRSFGFATATRTESVFADRNAQCFVIDTMGEMLWFYAACDVAFVGGSLVPIGGHNLLEPAALARPILVGPHTFNATEMTDELIASGGALRVRDSEQIGVELTRLLGHEDERESIGAAAMHGMERQRGAVERTLTIIDDVLEGRRPCLETVAA